MKRNSKTILMFLIATLLAATNMAAISSDSSSAKTKFGGNADPGNAAYKPKNFRLKPMFEEAIRMSVPSWHQ